MRASRTLRIGSQPLTARLPARLSRWLAAHQIGLSLLLLLAWTEETAWRLPADASYDLLNYHLYGPFALLHGKWARDLAPAQTQGFLPPTNDIPYYLLARHVHHVHVLNLLLALPAVAAIWLSFLIALRLLRTGGITARLVALVAVLIAATGAATHPVLASSMSDMIPCSLTLGAILLLLRNAEAAVSGSLPRGLSEALLHLLPGLLVGAALGLKLTLSYAAVGLVVALLARPDVYPLLRLRMAFLFCLGVGIGMLGTGGWWWLRMAHATGNPLFPLYNNLFQSPLALPSDYVDPRFFPRDTLHWLLYPFFWALRRAPLATELDVPMRDPRIALALLAAAAILARSFRGAPPARGPGRFVGVFFLLSFVLWERQFSIFRYLSLLEMLSGPLLAMLALDLARDERARRAVLGLAVLLLAILRVYTVYPNWGRLLEPGGRSLAVHVPALPPDALVLILDPAPLAYVAVFEPDGVRFLGTDNNLTRPLSGGPGRDGLMQQRIRAAIAAQPVHLYGLEKPGTEGHTADRTLAAYGLHRAGCGAVTGAIVGSTTRLCALTR